MPPPPILDLGGIKIYVKLNELKMQSNEIKVFDEVLHKYCILPRHRDIEYLTAMDEGHKGSI